MVFGMSELFVSPDWLNWQDADIKIWVSRSRDLALDVCLIELGTWDGRYAVAQSLQTVAAFTSRIHSLQIKMPFSPKDNELASFFNSPSCFPALQVLVIHNDNGIPMLLDLSKLPLLRTLHVPYLALRAESSHGYFKELGCQVFDSADLASLVELVGCQTTSFHLTLFANMRDHMPAPLRASHNYITCWRWLSSLRLYGYNGRGDQHYGSLFCQLYAPHLQLLELVDMEDYTFDVIIATMPLITLQSVEKLIIGPLDAFLKDYFVSLDITNPKSGEIRAFPNLLELVIWDIAGHPSRQTRRWWIDLPSMETCLVSRRNSLKRMVLPSTLRPTSHQIGEGTTLSVHLNDLNPGHQLTVRNEARLIAAGNLDEVLLMLSKPILITDKQLQILYEYTVDSYGFSPQHG
ncbi:hypothetical protein DL93DRAFT_2164452 [Clavulina sp. PMI_390]|nr:hypothetical protein DL93DRAFT_2164452 [Clavulina sp. PMI_390]